MNLEQKKVQNGHYGFQFMLGRMQGINGSMKIDSEPGNGTVVMLRVPLKLVQEAAMRVLLVDDHRLMLDGLVNLLDLYGIQVIGTAKDGLEAIDLTRKLHPDLILMDIRMPNCDGLEATRRIKAEMPEMKVVILTTSTEDQDLFEAVKSGACGYLLKSMDADELIEDLKMAQLGIPPFSPGLATKVLAEFARMANEKKEEGSVKKLDNTEKVNLTERQVPGFDPGSARVIL